MKVAYLASRYPAVSHTFIMREVMALRQAGIDVHTFTVRRVPDAELLSEADQAESARTTSLLPAGPLALLRAHFAAMLAGGRAYWAALCEALFRRPPGLRSAVWHVFYFLEAGLLAFELRRRGVAHVHAHFANVAANVAKLAACMSRGTWSLTLHGLSDFGDPTHSWLRDKIASAGFVVCVSDFGRSQAMLQCEPPHWAKLRRIHCGIDPHSFRATPDIIARRCADGSGSTPVRLLTVARLGAEKAHAILLEALQMVRQRGVSASCTFVGDGPQRDALRNLAGSLGVSQHVTFTGAVGQDRIREFYEAADIFVLPSLAEGLPVVLMEAMAMELPVIATRIMGIPELVEQGVNGLLVTPGCAAPLAQAILELARGPQRRADLGRHGRRTIQERFDIAVTSAALAQVFREHLQDRAAAPLGIGAAQQGPLPPTSSRSHASSEPRTSAT
ncbi:MAG: glycosyltransferase family 4 protein [Planctomycetes bacterium]|nr:glycosyltransferase family 4 protein [Planctomycetota bacterium]